MTKDEVLAQAQCDGFALVRGKITMVDHTGYGVQVAIGGATLAFAGHENIISIEPPPETNAEKIARLEARITELEALRAVSQAPLFSGAHPWATVAELETGQ